MEEKSSSGLVSYIRPVAMGLLFGTITIILLFLLFAFVIVKLQIPASTISLVVMLCAAAGAFLGGIISSRIYGKKGLIIGLINGLVFAVLLLITSAMFSNQFFSGENITKYIIMIIASIIGGIVGVNSKKTRR